MNFDLRAAAAEKILLVGHRGAWTGNIPCNTVTAYENAVRGGADMIEIDIDRTADGHFVIFHPGMEKPHLDIDVPLTSLTLDEVKKLRYRNIDDVETQFGIDMLDDVLETFKGRCYINTDKFWLWPAEISARIRAHGMTEQILVKTSVKKDYLDIVEEYCADIQYMAIAKTPDEMAAAQARRIRYVGTEVLFTSDDAPFASPEFIAAEHRAGRLVWANAIIYNYRKQLAAGHSDDAAIGGDPEGSWGWLADRGYDFIQTDHVLALSKFLDETGRRARRGLPC